MEIPIGNDERAQEQQRINNELNAVTGGKVRDAGRDQGDRKTKATELFRFGWDIRY